MTVALPDGEDGVYSAIGYAFDAPSRATDVVATASPWPLVGLIALGVLLPFFGVTLLVVLLLDQLVVRRVPFLGRWFSAQ